MSAGRGRATRYPGVRRSPLLLLAGTIVVLIGAFSATATGAAPSRFVYELCDSDLAGGNPPAATFSGSPAFTPFQTCAQEGGSIGITETGPSAGDFAYWAFGIPATPGGLVESVTASGAAVGLGPGNDHTYAYEQGWPQNNAPESKRTFQNSSGEEPFYFSEQGFRILMNCDGNVPGGCGPGPSVAIHYIAATEVDPHPPTLTSVSGSILTPGVLRGHQDLGVEARDEGGGVARLEGLVNGVPATPATTSVCNVAAVDNPSYTGVAALGPTPCPATQKAGWLLDTASPPFQNGANTVQVCASDFATVGEAGRSCSSAQPIVVDNSCVESAVTGGGVLTAQFARTHKEEVTVPFDTAAKVTGELADDAGDAISGATICVQIRTQGARSGLRPVGTATTDADGRFVYKVPPGPNRKVLVGYRHDSFQIARAIRYYAHAKPKLTLSRDRIRTGGEIRIRGSLPGRRAAGRVVVLQAGALGSDRWFTFRRATTDRDGDFHSRYRFDATTRTTTYKIRAVVPRQRGYPWESGHSRPALVEVRG